MVEPKWEWVDSVFGMIIGFVTGILSLFGWVNSKTQVLHERINKMNNTVSEHSAGLAVLDAHHEANEKFQSRVDGALITLQEQNTEQLRLLSEMRGAVSNNHSNHRRES